MKKDHYLLSLGVSAAAGTVLGLFADRRHPARGGLLGAAAGVVAGSIVAGFYHYVSAVEKVPYYSKSSPLYDELDTL
ncbi:MAG TPA: hypothetical protein VK435_02055 [Thermodesulfovibrionales bacterium]|nr:hypothetical protein [Thermodesulfovibrionales bacterium]